MNKNTTNEPWFYNDYDIYSLKYEQLARHFLDLVDYIVLNWNYLIKEFQEWQSLGMAIEQARADETCVF